MENKEWASAHQALLSNLKIHSYSPQSYNSVKVVSGGIKSYLPAYIPYIGPLYFRYRPRILCYAINQNLSKHVPWTNEWLSLWSLDQDIAYDRLNYAAKQGNVLPIKPYAEGFIPLVALIAIKRWLESKECFLPEFVDDVIAVTNFVKFSTVGDASSSSIPLEWWRECGKRFVAAEISILRPDIIICFGLKTMSELIRVLNNYLPSEFSPEILKCRFPARIPSIKSQPLSKKHLKIWKEQILPLVERIRKNKSPFHIWKIHNYANFFVNTAINWD